MKTVYKCFDGNPEYEFLAFTSHEALMSHIHTKGTGRTGAFWFDSRGRSVIR